MRALPAFGQNFLTHKPTIKKIVSIIDTFGHSAVLEVGPGKGAFTIPLSSKVDDLISVEVDDFLASELGKTLENNEIDNVNVINNNILSFDPAEMEYGVYALFGSLPYNISKRIIRKFMIDAKPKPTHIHVIIQKEVADQYMAEPPKATYLSNFADIFSSKIKHMSISRHNFSPTPAVDGTFITFELMKVEEEDVRLDSFIKKLFRKPRKTIRNNIKYLLDDRNIERNNHTIDLNKRPSELTQDEFRRLFIVYNTECRDGE